jgi:hypothetical protein
MTPTLEEKREYLFENASFVSECCKDDFNHWVKNHVKPEDICRIIAECALDEYPETGMELVKRFEEWAIMYSTQDSRSIYLSATNRLEHLQEWISNND